MSSVNALQVPGDANFDVKSSSFFQHHDRLPSPDEVRSQARAQYLAGTHWGNKRRCVSTGLNLRPSPAVFESMNLYVKWGCEMRIAEGQTLYAMRHYLGNAVPVPEIYGWRTDGDQVFLYMEAISGRTLEQCWPEMEEDDRLRICRELRAMCDAMRQLKQDPSDTFVGTIARGTLYDRAINPRYMAEAGPFTSVKEFHEWFTSLYKRPMPDPTISVPDPYRQDLPDNSEIVFTHGDLHRSNIILSTSTPHRVVAIVDWEQAGWLPAYWEDRKAHVTSDYFGDWSEKYLPVVLDQYKSTWDPWDYYTTSMGC
ncbi:kinase-like protein [Karstenula rhodostoma CBS 690.94]|uniref:Kinase-like protein n=1 Tax=Karstenula rhodostoma CBS 690.94 TaxID=1392251 RepID=A0A9P4P988_9PLEO|nr:kinase-like protein [Karstenula rhodostoma CBS 690.94]